MAFVGCRSSQRNAFPWENSGGCTLAPFGGRAGSPSAVRSINAFAAFAGVCCGKEKHGKAVELKKRRCYWQLPSCSSMKDRSRTARRPPKTTQDHPRPPQRRNPGLAEPGPSRQAPRHHKPFFRWPFPSAHDPPPSGAGRSLLQVARNTEYKGPAIGICSNRSVGLSVCLIDGSPNP